MVADNSDKIAALSQIANDLVNEVNKLNDGTGKKVDSLTTRVRRNQHVQLIVLASFALDIVLTVVLGITISHTQANANRLNDITHRLDYNANVQRKQVLCPLYKVFIDAKSEAGRQHYPKGAKEYDRLFGVLQGSYNALQCDKTHLKPLPSPK